MNTHADQTRANTGNAVANNISKPQSGSRPALKNISRKRIVQLKELSGSALNVAGEDHDESDKRRDTERMFAEAESRGTYWTEEQFPVTIETDEGESGQVSADPLLLQWSNGIRFLSDFTEGFRQNYLALYTPGSDWTLQSFRTTLNAVVNAALSTVDLFSDLKGKSPKDRRLLNAQSNTTTIEKIIGQEEGINKIKAANASIRVKARAAGDNLKGAEPDQHREIVKRDCKIFDELGTLQTETNKLLESQKYDLDYRAISATRSIHMVAAAQQQAEKIGVWKIGQAHADHMKGSKDLKFNLLTQMEFNEAFTKWSKKKNSK